MNRTHQLLCAWAGPAFTLLFGVGFWLFADFLPPHRPAQDAAAVAALFHENAAMIRLGTLLVMTGAGLSLAFVAVLSSQIRRIETGTPVLTYVQLLGGCAATMLLLLPTLLWTVAAFRPERAPEITQLVNDTAWLMTVMPFPPACVQLTAIALAILGDRSATPLLPRWAGFLNLWVAVLFLPGGLASFFKTGPFAWNGLFAFWVAAFAFFAWIIVMSALVLRAIRR